MTHSANGLDAPATAEDLLTLYLSFGKALSEEASHGTSAAAAAITRLSVKTVPGVEQASISEGRAGRFRTLTSTGPMATAGDQIQYHLRSGPCVDALTDDVVYRSGDISRDQRWPEFGRRATAETGALSMLSIRLFLEDDGDHTTGLNMYSTAPAAFGDTAQNIASLLAAYSAHVLKTVQAREKAANLEKALDSNREIGTAMGILMATHKIARTDAFELLRVASQHTNRKLIDIATTVVDTGTLGLDVGDLSDSANARK